jgi:hypothetical protein
MAEIDPLNFIAGKVIATVSGNLRSFDGRASALHYASMMESELHALTPAQRRSLFRPVQDLNLYLMRACAADSADRRAQYLAVVAVLTLLVKELVAEDAELLRLKREAAPA